MMNVYYGPWIWDTVIPGSAWRGPVGSAQSLDLRSVPQQSTRGGAPGMGVFVSTADKATVGSDYDLLGKGSLYEIKATAKMRAALRKHANAAIDGDDLVGMLLSLFTDGADPDGNDFGKPLTPTADGRIELHLCGKHAERFRWGSAGTSKIRQAIRKDFQRLFGDVQAGRTRDKQIHRKALDYLCEKYGVEDWKEFVPPALQGEIPGRLPHETTITESFDTSDSDTLGPDLTWTETVGDWDIVTNAAELQSSAGNCWIRAESDLSGSDHYAQCTWLNSTSADHAAGPAARYDSSATTMYTTIGLAGNIYLQKFIGGAATVIGSASMTHASNDVFKTYCSGSTIKSYLNTVELVSVTDTAISGNTRGGIRGYYGSGPKPRVDAFEAADLSAGGGILYTQLERSTRGLNRGMYTGGM